MLPGRYARVRSQIWQRVTGRWVTVTGKRRELGVLIIFHDASPAGVTLPSVLARTRDSRHERTALSGAEVASRATNNRQVLDAD
jgi:hypothetical protein